ncbi:hypothetical protein PF008_g1849 [Phytophthora fragariae]|uniref:Uncharacterized protein n=1 Tax=Phytophthora fragariae TaxID=53985 RepID=A0A6G0SJ25_9STRA|nr:hypothetical protein PF008_g1849 [Phytophthora fragariae]
MPAEYAARMEVLERRREELTAQRQAVEKRMALREATAAEFSAVALQSCRQKWKTQRSAAIAAQKRNDEFVRSLREAQRQVHNTCVKLQGDQSRSGVLLAQEKACYNRRIEQVYPAWQEQLQRHRVQKLKELEDKKRAVERRRYLAKKSFEKEQTLDDLIRKTRHEVEMAENLEQNELYERELLRTQSTNQAKEVDQGIREVALDARSYLQQQAAKHLEMMPELDEELAEKLSETFSPRNTLRALREGGSSLAFEENQPYEEEKPARQIQVEIPARMNTSTLPYYPDVNQQGPNQAFHYDDVEFQDDYDNEIACEFDDRAAHPNPPRTERRVAQTITNAGNGYTTFKQSANTHQPAFVAQRDQPPATMFRSLDTEPGATASQTASYYGNEQDRTAPSSVPIRNEKHNKTVDVSRERVDILPTLVTGTLETIPEANETVSSGGTSPMISSKPIADNNMADRLNGRESASISGSSAIDCIAQTSPPVQPSSSSISSKVEENWVASSPDTPCTPATPVDGSLQSDEKIKLPDEHQAPEPPINDAQHLSATIVLESKEAFVASPYIADNTPKIPNGIPLQDLHDNIPSEEKADEVPKTNHETSLSTYGNSLIIDDVSTSTSRKTEDSVSMDVALASESLFETKTVSAEAMGANRTIEVAPHASLVDTTEDDQVVEEGPSHDKSREIDLLHGTKACTITDTIDASLSMTTETPALDELAKDAGAIVDNEAPIKVPESPPASIGYTTDFLEPFSPAASTPANAESTENDMLLTSMQSDDFDLSANNNVKGIAEIAETKSSIPPIEGNPHTTSVISVVDSVESHVSAPETPVPEAVLEETNTVSITEKLSPVDRVKALGALISRVEEGATEGDTLGGSTDTGSSNKSKRDLLKMAVGGRKAQIAFFGSDICFELVLDISRDLGPVLFPPKAFEGIMNDQKIRKLHQSNKEKQLDLWKALSGHLKQLVQLKAISSTTLVDLFVTAFLAHDPENQRSQRKLREFLAAMCGGGGSGSRTPSPRKEISLASPPPSPPKQEQRSSSPESTKTADSEDRIRPPPLLQTAFLQRQSPPKPKVFGIASSSFNDRSSGSSDVLASMSAGPMKLSQKLMRGGKMNDYSEFEEEEEVDLQNLIGTKSAFASGSSSMGRGSYQTAKTSPTGKSAAKKAAAEEEEDEFDADF